MLYENWFNRAPSNQKVTDMFTLDSVVDEETLITKNGELVKVLEIGGIVYSGLDSDVIAFIRKQRQRFFKRLNQDFAITIYTFNTLEKGIVTTPEYKDALTQKIVNKHNENFKDNHVIRHYLVIRTKRGAAKTNILFAMSNKRLDDVKKTQYDNLNALTKNLVTEMRAFSPRLLTHNKKARKSELLSFFARLLNGKAKEVFTSAHEFGEYIANTDIELPKGNDGFKDYMVHKNGIENRYSTWLAVKEFPDTSNSLILATLFELPYEILIKQSFIPSSTQDTLKKYSTRLKREVGLTEHGRKKIAELTDLIARVDDGDIAAGYFSFSIQIYGNSINELNETAREVIATLSRYGIESIRETINLEALYWSSFPDNEHLNVRNSESLSTNETLADFVTFQGVDKGQLKCTYGNEPHCYFKTDSGANHGFIFHKDTSAEANGNTLIIGGSGAGKTTLITFIIANLTKHEGFKALLFDRYNGAEIPMRMLDGMYTSFEGDCELNPFQLADTESNRSFLSGWLQTITGKKDDESIEIINRVINANYELDKDHRNFTVLLGAFGLKKEGSIRSAIEKWLPDGANGTYLNGRIDGLDFSKNLVGYDMTTLLNEPEVLAAITSYIFHSFMRTLVQSPSPNLVFFDELVKFLDSPIGHKIPMFPQEIRKLNGVFVGAVQEAKVVTEHKYGTALLDSCETFMIFPNKTGKKEDYITGLGLTESEFDWVKSPSHRKVLVKRKSGGSTVLNIDLSPLGDYLQVFNSSRSEVDRLQKCMKDGRDWKNEFLKGAHK